MTSIPIYLDNCTPSGEQVDFSTIKSTGNAEPSGRLLDGSSDHGFDQEWLESATLADGRSCSLVYLLNDEDFLGEDGEPFDDLSNVDWLEHLVRVRLEF